MAIPPCRLAAVAVTEGNAMKHDNPLAALFAAAVALPGISQAAAPVQNTQIEVSYSEYHEESIAAGDVAFGSVDRYDIDVSDFSFVTPVGGNNQIQLAYSTDRLSGASPWFVMQGPDGYVQAMSGATIWDERRDILASWSHFTDDQIMTVQMGRSEENDYLSNNIGVSFEQELNNANTVLGIAYSKANDEVSASDRDIFPTRPEGEDKDVDTLSLSLSQVINPKLIVRAGYSREEQRGFLSDPYKLASVSGMLLQDNRPGARKANIFTLGTRQYLAPIESALKVDYRFYGDNWGIDSNTLTLALHKTITAGFSIEPNVRWYSQSRANFYANAFDDTTFYSSDPRLAEFNGSSYGFIVNKSVLSAVVSLSYEQYKSSSDVADPLYKPLGLVDYSLFTLSVRVDVD